MSIEKETVFSEKNMYKRPSDYFGMDWFGYAHLIGRTRDSGCLENSNWETACEWLSKWLECEESGVEIRACNHWAVGWTEEIMIKETAPDEAIDVAYKILKKIEDYPILNENLYNELVDKYAQDTWECMDTEEREEALRKCGYVDIETIIHSKHPPFGGHDDGKLWEILTADCDL